MPRHLRYQPRPQNCSCQRHQWHGDLAHLGPLLPQYLNRVVDRLLDLRMHASVLVQFTDQADAYALQIATETGCVIGHWPTTGKRVARIISSDSTEDQGTVLHR